MNIIEVVFFIPHTLRFYFIAKFVIQCIHCNFEKVYTYIWIFFQAPVGTAAYQYQYEVSDPEGNNFFGQGEKRDGAVTSGSYFVLLPDGRRQRVDYTVNGAEGFVSTVTYN